MVMNKNKNFFELTLPSEREIVITRIFDIPRRFVFEAYSKPEHMAYWWGLEGSQLPVCEMDFRPGGSWRYILRGSDGSEYSFEGVYQEILSPERLVYTEIFEPFEEKDGECLVTLDFEEKGDCTILTSTSLYSSLEIRDMVLRSGMESGSSEAFDRLAKYLLAVSYKP